MKNVLIIGGAGYVGTVLTSYLLKRGYSVTVLDNLVYNNHSSIVQYLGDSNYSFVKGDMSDSKILSEAAEGVTDVVLLAGLVGDPITKKFPIESEMINDRGVQHCMSFFKKTNIDKFIFISTCSNYGLIKEDELADENFVLNPLSSYAKSKVAAEKFLLAQKDEAEYTGVVLRFATAFGLSPRMRFDLSLSEFVRDMFFEQDLIVFDEHTWRPYCHTHDFARLIEIVIKAPKKLVGFEIFNAGGDVNNSTKKMIVDNILKYLPNAKVKYKAEGSDPRNYKVSFKKVKTVLGFEPDFRIDDGINELIRTLKLGFYYNSLQERDKYGNYSVNHKI
ncbi:MAG: NAD(P)-dependent oxidoreductase [Cyclobacteriaceae bacterium]|nr:NAD(P)-dependent oxidoreductase [Cyclobacteriaceae bacterium]